MIRVAWAVLAAALAWAVALPAHAAPEHSFQFEIPDGWIDLSPGTPAANADDASPLIREATRRLDPDTVVYAAMPGEDVVMSVLLRAEVDSEPIDPASLARAARQIGWEDHFVVEEQRIETVGGLAWGRFTGHTDKNTRFLLYLVPGRPRSALVLFSAPPEAFDDLVTTFEAAAMHTRGAALPAARSDFPVGLLTLGTVAMALLPWNRLKRRSRAAKQPS